MRFNETAQKITAWVQIVAAILCLVLFFFLTVKQQIFLIGIVTMVTWIGTGLSHLSSAEANEKLVEDTDYDGQ